MLTENAALAQGVPQGTLGDDDTIPPSSRTISVAGGKDGAGPTRVISSSGLLGDAGGFLGVSKDFAVGVQAATEKPAVATETRPYEERFNSISADSDSQQGVAGKAEVRPDTVPRHKRPRRREVGTANAVVADLLV